ncbi:MAG: hypothetical protein AMXMBFR4_27450 [Candidatus Hydrogenedentota bacterium]
MFKKVVVSVFMLAITAGMFVLLFYPQAFGLSPELFQKVSPRDMLEELRQAGAPSLAFWLTAAVLVRLSGMLCGVLRWRVLLRGQGIHIPFWYMVGSWFIGRTFGIFLPGTLGLDGYRLYDSAMYTGEVIKCTTVIAIEKLIGIIALTFLVFVTFPMGFRLIHMSVPMLAVTLLILGVFVAISFITLLNPRVIQVLVSALPTPAFIRSKVNKLGASVTAYSGKRSDLLLAVFYGFIVHAATALMYFCTMMAIRTPHTSILDVLFASPLVIYSRVLSPTAGKLGPGEIVGVALLGEQSGAAAALTFIHLGWWVGDVAPFLVGLPILLFRRRPSAASVRAKLDEMRQGLPPADDELHLTPEEISSYRGKLLDYGFAGIGAGLVAGAITGLCEARWLVGRVDGLQEVVAYWWGPLVYGLCFSAVGLGIAGALVFLALVRDRFFGARTVFGLSLGGSLAAAVLIIGRFRYRQDILGEFPLSMQENIAFLGSALAIAAVAALAAIMFLAVLRAGRERTLIAGAASYVLLILVGIALTSTRETARAVEFAPSNPGSGPNIILIAVDTLRADYLRMYDEAGAVANTPAIDALREDSVLYLNCFAQSSWTKASFATLFSGQYPESHTAMKKDSMLPDSVVTFPELLMENGYYTQGYCNNPNIADTYNYGQGFVEYLYLKPRFLFGAAQSAEKMALYKVLRQVYFKAMGKITGGRINVADFYQPGDVVTQTGLEWLDSADRPNDAPFFLFLHYMDPHDPYMDHKNPGVGYARVRLGDAMKPEEWKNKLRDAYIGEIEFCDQQIGKLIDGLKQRGLYDNSVIVFTSDHGEEFHEHGGWWHGLSLYDEQIGVPLLIKLPKNELAGETNVFMTRHVDLAPTLLQFAGVPKDDGMQGTSLFMVDNAAEWGNNEVSDIYSHLNFEGIELRAVRTPSFKLIQANEGNKRNYKPVELYHVEKDPEESENLAGMKLEEEQILTERLGEMRKAAEDRQAIPESGVMTPEMRDALKSLGYVGN